MHSGKTIKQSYQDKPDIGVLGTTGRPSSRVTRTKKNARDVANGKQLTLEIVKKGKK